MGQVLIERINEATDSISDRVDALLKSEPVTLDDRIKVEGELTKCGQEASALTKKLKILKEMLD